MSYSPGIQDQRGQLLAQGIGQFGEGVASGLQAWRQNETMAAQALGNFKGAVSANPDLLQFLNPDQPSPNAPDDVVKAYSKLHKDGTVGLKDAALLSTFGQAYQTQKDNKQKQELQQAQTQQQQFMLKEAQDRKAEEDRLNEKLGQYARIGEQMAGPNGDMVTGPGGYDQSTIDSVKSFMKSPISDVVKAGARVTPTMLADYALKTRPTLDNRAEVADVRAQAAREAATLRGDAFDATQAAKTVKAENDKLKADKKDAAQAFDETAKLRTEFNSHPNTKSFDVVDQFYKRGVDLAKEGNAAGDMGLIFSLMKVYDPSSTVREGEYATASNSGSAPDQILNMYNKIRTGEKLQPEQRQQFLETMSKAAQAQYGKLLNTVGHYQTIAQKSGIDPEQVIDPSYLKWSPQGASISATAAAPIVNAPIPMTADDIANKWLKKK